MRDSGIVIGRVLTLHARTAQRFEMIHAAFLDL
jgi:hypothetical protein